MYQSEDTHFHILRMLHQGTDRQEFLGLRERLEALPESANKDELIRGVEMGITIRERFEQHQLRERGLLAVIETAQDLTALTDLDRVLRAIVQRARKLVGCDVGYLSIYDEQQGDFYVRATDGAFSEKFKQVRVGIDTGVCGFVARNRSPYASSHYETDSRFMHDHLIDSAMLDENIQSILGVPLLAGEQVIGVLFVADRYVRSYVAWEMSILSTLAAHASVAIGNARLFEQAEFALQQASAANALLVKQTSDTRAAAEVHEQLTSLVARGGELRDICHMVANRLAGHVVVCDEGELEVCDATAPGYRHQPLTTLEHGIRHKRQDKIHEALNESRRLGRSVVAFSLDDCVCRVSAVSGGAGLLGGLIIYTASSLNDVAVRILERSSLVTSVVMLLKERRESTLGSDNAVALRRLVLRPQSNLDALALQTTAYGLDLTQPVCVVLVQVQPDKASYIVQQLRGVLKNSHALFDEVGGVLTFVVNEAAAQTLQELLLRYFADRRLSFTGIVSNPVTDSARLPDSFQSASHCLRFLDVLERRDAIFHERDMSMYSFLFEKLDTREIDEYLHSILGPLYEPGVDRKAELGRTLLAYLDHGYSAGMAAKALDIHINTFRQRLDALDALLGSWRNSTRALEIHIGLRLWRLRAPGLGGSKP